MMYYCTFYSPLGLLYIGADENDAICWLGNAMPHGEAWQQQDTPTLAQAQDQLTRYFEGCLFRFSLPLAPKGTPFQQAVWQALRNVPYGETITYKDLAQRAGHPGASRAVGGAMAKNPIVLVQPCHRVLPASGRIGNYSMGGPANKEWLLLLERQNNVL